MYSIHDLPIEEVNNLISEHFIKIFGNVVEHNPAAAIRVLKNRPFGNAMDIYLAVQQYLYGLNQQDKEAILSRYPDVIEEMTDLSRFFLEIGKSNRFAGSDSITIEDKLKLGQLNRKYKDKFGFPFVIYNKGTRISTMFSEMEDRIENTKETEINIAIEEVLKFAKMRIFEIVRR